MSKETIKRALQRGLYAFVMGALASFVAMPVDLNEPKKYLTILFVAMLTGGLMGLQKLASGYVKYDKK